MVKTLPSPPSYGGGSLIAHVQTLV